MKMKQAIIRLNKNQYKVFEGEELLVDKLNNKTEAEVLFYSDDQSTKIGTPVLKDVKVKLEILDPEVKGRKLHVNKFRAKSRYRRKKGFRPVYTKIKIKTIS